MRARRDDLPIVFGTEPTTIRGSDWGELRSLILSLPAGTDVGPLLRGLPDDLCPCPHWGYVLTGRLQVTYADGEETLTAGDLFYLPPGHTVVVTEDAEIVEFSPTGIHETVMEVVRKNAAAAAPA